MKPPIKKVNFSNAFNNYKKTSKPRPSLEVDLNTHSSSPPTDGKYT